MLKDPHKQYRKSIIISLLLLGIGIGQLFIVISGRSWLVWSYNGNSGFEGEETVSVPQSYLLPNRYLIIVSGIFPLLYLDPLVGNITLTRIDGGEQLFLDYRIVGFWVDDGVKTEAWSVILTAGRYNISWSNTNDHDGKSFNYIITTHGLFNWFFEDDRYPFTAESVALFISIILLVFFVGYSIRKYQEGKRDLSYYKA
ncbi:MAG: hypothetical protein JSV62_15490 [Promethearchaeota archaeon]|nr:MAG: hypothetical protein JSV62_15490 [Candidatus Lokiarchaeota archaeon]